MNFLENIRNEQKKILSLHNLNEDMFGRFRSCYYTNRGSEDENEDGDSLFVYAKIGGSNIINYVDEIYKIKHHPLFLMYEEDTDDDVYINFWFKRNIKSISNKTYWEFAKKYEIPITEVIDGKRKHKSILKLRDEIKNYESLNNIQGGLYQ